MSLTKKVIHGGVWLFTIRISKRILDFLRTVILARFLAPHDFGLMGIAILTLQTLEAFSQTGFQEALIQRRNDAKDYLNAAWTVLVLRGALLFCTIILTAPFISKFFETAEATSLIQVLGLSFLIQGIFNIGVINFQKELNFKKQYMFELTGLIFDFLLSIILVLILKNVWALVIGKICGDLARLLASYLLDSHKPRFEFNIGKIKKLQQFGKWVSGVNILFYITTQGDSIIVGKLFGPTALGLYKLSSTIANAPTTDITGIISQVTFPAYAQVQDDLNKLKKGFFKTLYSTAPVSFILSFVIFAFAGMLTQLFLGEKWLSIVPIIKILVIAGFIRSIAAIPGPIFQAIGKPHIDTIAQIIRLAAFIIPIYPLSKALGLEGIVYCVLISIFCAFCYVYFKVYKIFTIKRNE